ncbi:MAG: glutathione S-transferase [Pseudomonadota bacterium]
MKLFYSPLSPYVRKVMIVAHELGLVDAIETVEGAGTPMAPNNDVVAANPVGRIPALVTDDAGTLVDSRVICRYLNHRGGGNLYGSGAGEFPIIAREALAEGIADSSLLAAYEYRLRPEEIRYQPWIDGQRAKMMRGLKAFDDRIAEMDGDMTIDGVALIAAVGHIDYRHGDLGWRETCPALAEWISGLADRPSVAATAPPPA